MKKHFFHNPYPTLLWMLFILILCLIPSNPNHPKRFEWIPENADKIVHFALYFVLSFLVVNFLFVREIKMTKAFIFSLIISIAYGLMIEVLQEYFTQTRHFEWFDVLANSLGALGGCISFCFLKFPSCRRFPF